MILLHPRKIIPKSSDGAEQELISNTIYKIVQGQDSKLIKMRVRHRKILGLSNEVRKKKKKGAGPSTLRMTNMKRGSATH